MVKIWSAKKPLGLPKGVGYMYVPMSGVSHGISRKCQFTYWKRERLKQLVKTMEFLLSVLTGFQGEGMLFSSSIPYPIF